jgi:ABC-2 type transport system permease protein
MSEAGVEKKTEGVPARVESGSSISDLSYRSYDGPIRARYARWWVVAQSGLRRTWGQWWFYILIALPLIRFLIAGFLMFWKSQLGVQMGNYLGEPEGQLYALQFWSVLCGDVNSLFLLIIALVVGAGSISADLQANALLVYFSKPIGKVDYLVGKWMGIFLTIFGVAFIPSALLYLFCVVSYREEGFLTSEPWLGPRLLLATLVPAILHASLIVGISAWSKSPRIVAAIYTSIYIVSGILVTFVGNILFKNSPEMRNVVQHCSLRGLIIGIDQNIMHVVVPVFAGFRFRRLGGVDVVEIPKLWPLVMIAGGLVVASLTAAWVKIRAVEVVKG